MKKVIFALFYLFLTQQSLAQSSIENVDVRTGDDGAVVIDFKFSNGSVQPELFSTNLPPRLALDFAATDNASNVRNMAIGISSVKGLRVVSSEDKTRVVVDLMNQVTHELSTVDNVVSLSLKGKNFERRSVSGVGSKVEVVDFRRGLEGQGIIQVELSNADSVINYSESLGKVTVDISNSQLAESMDKKLDVIDFATPVSYVDARQTGEGED